MKTEDKIKFAEGVIKVSEWKIGRLRLSGNHPIKINRLLRMIESQKQLIATLSK